MTAYSPTSSNSPIIIAGPCLAESQDILFSIAETLLELSSELNFELFFKASYDKANRTSKDSYRGPGRTKALAWMHELKRRFACQLATDIHETQEVSDAAEVCEMLQIPAFLCRQTDLLLAASSTNRLVNIKKGQFLAPAAMQHIVNKAEDQSKVLVTERGTCFGYGDLVVDPRSFTYLAKTSCPVIFDITHSTQRPPSGDLKTSGACRQMAPILARTAASSGYVDGFFLEVHPDPAQAKSDSSSQLNPDQARKLLRQVIPLWRESKEKDFRKLDDSFV